MRLREQERKKEREIFPLKKNTIKKNIDQKTSPLKYAYNI